MNALTTLLALLTRRQRYQLLGLFVLMIVGALLEAAGVSVIMPFIMLLQDPEMMHRKVILKRVALLLGSPGPREFLLWMGSAMLFLYVGKNAFLALAYHWQFRFVYGLQVAVGRRLLAGYLYSPYPFHLQRNPAELLKNITNEVQAVFHNFMIPGLTLVTELLVVTVLTGVLIAVNPLAASAAALSAGALTYLFYRIIRKKTHRRGQLQQQHNEAMLKCVNQALGSIKETKVLGREHYFVDRFTNDAYGFARTLRHLQFVTVAPRLVLETIAFVALIAILLVTLVRSPSPQAIAPLLALFAMAAFRLLPSVNRITSMLTHIRFFRPALDVVAHDISRFALQPGSVPPSMVRRAPNRLPFTQALTLRDVTYHYEGAATPSIHSVSLVIPRGSAVAFVGPTGAGKTTLVDLMLGLLQPTEGTIAVDGHGINDCTVAWQRNIGYIPQTIYLTDDTIRRNIAFGVPDAAIDNAMIWDALRAAQLERFVTQLPGGLETVVGERGVRISGGERQRIGIARALYHDPEVLVMDEATSSLDNDTEQAVTESIEQLSGLKTLIVIAHRLTTVQHCDTIYRIQDGRLVDRLTYEALVGTNLSA